MKINWKIRFKNPNFIFRFIAALIVPALASMGIEWQSLTTWGALGQALLDIVSNPVVLILMFYNALNMTPDGTTKGINDSYRALSYERPQNQTK